MSMAACKAEAVAVGSSETSPEAQRGIVDSGASSYTVHAMCGAGLGRRQQAALQMPLGEGRKVGRLKKWKLERERERERKKRELADVGISFPR